MKKYIKLVLIVLLLLLILVGYIAFNRKQNVNKVYPSVVHIECKNDNTTTKGSGIVYDYKKGKYYIVTSYHIIKGYANVDVYDSNLNSQKATILNYDEENDIAILYVEDKLNVKKGTFDIYKELNIDEQVYILTSDIGEDESYITKEGTILSINENINLNDVTFSVIKINSNIQKGDSGSLLIDKKGKIIGMIFLKDKENNHIGYALHIKFVFDKIEELEKDNNNLNLGALMTSANNSSLMEEYNINITKEEGVVLLSVKKDYPLYKAGLKKGDLIVKFNNKEIKNIEDLKNEMKKLNYNDDVSIEYYRNNKLKKANIKLNK